MSIALSPIAGWANLEWIDCEGLGRRVVYGEQAGSASAIRGGSAQGVYGFQYCSGYICMAEIGGHREGTWLSVLREAGLGESSQVFIGIVA